MPKRTHQEANKSSAKMENNQSNPNLLPKRIEELKYFIRMKNIRKDQYLKTQSPAMFVQYRAVQKEIQRQVVHLKGVYFKEQGSVKEGNRK